MGHIVSSLAFRLGSTRTWIDEWFIEKLYYAYFLHTALKITYFFMVYLFYHIVSIIATSLAAVVILLMFNYINFI